MGRGGGRTKAGALLPQLLATAPAYVRAAYASARAAGRIISPTPQERFQRPQPGPDFADMPTYHLAFLERLLDAEAGGLTVTESDHLVAIRSDWGVGAPWERPNSMRLGLLCGSEGCGKTTALVWAGRLAALEGRKAVRYLKAGPKHMRRP